MAGSKLPRVTAGELLRALGRAGFVVKRQGANHVILTHRERGGRVEIPRHATKTLKPKTLLSALDQAGPTADQLRELL